MADNQQVATRAPNPLITFRGELEARAAEIKMALPQGIDAGRFQRTVITAAQQNADLLKADRRSLLVACIKAAQDGLVPDGREAALVVFSTRVKEDGNWVSKKLIQYMPMVYGLRKKILQARDADGKPIVSALTVGVVYRAEVANGYFLWERGSDPEVQHRPMLDISEEEAADSEIVAAYSIATMSDGTRSCEVMRRFEIDKVREMSQTGAVGRVAKYDMGDIKKGQLIPPKGPWVDWFAEMAKKTVMRRHSKTLPMSGDVIMGLGSEDEHELDPSLSTAAVLGSHAGSEPEQLEDQSDDEEASVADRETGEILDRAKAEERVAAIEEEFAKAKTAKAKRETHDRHALFISDLEAPFPDLHERAMAAIPADKEPRQAKAKADEAPPSAEGNAGSTGHAEPDATTQNATGSDVSGRSTTSGAASAGGDDRDLLGITKHPAEAEAERLLDKMAKIRELEELDREYDAGIGAREEWPPEILTALRGGYQRHRRRLGAHAEPAQ